MGQEWLGATLVAARTTAKGISWMTIGQTGSSWTPEQIATWEPASKADLLNMGGGYVVAL